MEKRRVGKLQIVLGILILLLSIFGLVMASSWKNELKRSNEAYVQNSYSMFEELNNASNPLSNETKILLSIDFSNRFGMNFYSLENRTLSLFLCSIILFVLSLILITQGLSNTSKK